MLEVRHEGTKARSSREYRRLFVSWCLRGLLIAAIVVGAQACGANKPPEEKDYTSKIAADRAQKDASFAGGDDPIPREKHALFLPLAYFPIDPGYNVPASLKPTN